MSTGLVTCVVNVKLDAVRFTLKRVVSEGVIILVRVYQCHTVCSTHHNQQLSLDTERPSILNWRTMANTLKHIQMYYVLIKFTNNLFYTNVWPVWLHSQLKRLRVQISASLLPWAAAYTHVSLTPSSIIWYQLMGGDAFGWEGNCQPGKK